MLLLLHLHQLLPQDLVVPIEVEVVLVGFSGDGGYGYTLDSSKLLSMLSSHLQVRHNTGWHERRGVHRVNHQAHPPLTPPPPTRGWGRGGAEVTSVCVGGGGGMFHRATACC
jgi:hypothetical protein